MIQDLRIRYSLVALAALLAHILSITGGFSWDELRILYSIPSDFTPIYEFAYNRPLFSAMLDLERALFGDSVAWYHMVNLALHALNSIMVLLLAGRVLNDPDAALVSALVFALHPGGSEAVGWVFAGSHLLKVFFMLASMHLYLIYRDERNMAALMAGALFSLLAFLSGQAALVLPVIVLMYGAVNSQGGRGMKLPGLIYIGAAIMYAAFFWGRGEFAPEGSLNIFNIYAALMGLGHYAVGLFIPLGLGFMPGMGAEPLNLVMALLIVAATVMLMRDRRTREMALMLLIVSVSLVPAILVLMSESSQGLGMRHAYAAMPWFSILLGMAFRSASNRRLAGSFVLAILALFAVGSIDRALTWGDRVALWAEASATRTQSSLPRINYSAALISAGRTEDALKELRLILGRDSLSSDGLRDSMSLLHKATGGDDAKMFSVLADTKEPAKAYLAIGFMYFGKYRSEKDKAFLTSSLRNLQKAVDLSPEMVMARYYLGLGYLEAGHFNRSAEQMMAVNSIEPKGPYTANALKYLKAANSVMENPDSFVLPLIGKQPAGK